jgi:alkaline phosphatase
MMRKSDVKYGISGKSTGVVSTARIYHATPAASYAKSCSRKWEDDSKLPPDARGKCKDIAAQLIERGRNITVGGLATPFLF